MAAASVIRMPRLSCCLALLGLVGCGVGPDPSSALQSGSFARSEDGSVVWAAHPDEGVVSRTDLESGDSLSLTLAGDPSQVARSGNRLYVSLPARGSVVALDITEAEPLALFETPVGSEPAGIVARRSDGHVFLALAGENRVVELNPLDLSEIRGWDIPGFPSGLAIHPEGHSLYVSSTFGGRLSRIVIETGVITTLDIPTEEVVVAATDGSGDSTVVGERSPRITSAPAITEGGDRVVVGLQRLDTTSTAGEGSYVTFGEEEGPRVETSLAWAELSATGEPGPLQLVDATVTVDRDGVDRFSYLGEVAWSADGKFVAASMEASDVVAVYAVDGAQATLAFEVPAPGGLSFNGAELLVQSEFGAALVQAGTDAADEYAAGLTWETLAEGTPISIPALDEDLALGRRLFRTAIDPSVSLAGTATACSGCHTPAGTDGLTWPLPDGYRQTPALHAGTVDTAPYQWDGEVRSIADEALATSVDRMGGDAMTDTQAEAIAAWIGSRRTLSPPTRLDAAAVSRGAALFESLACSTCHAGSDGTDRDRHEIGGVRIDTPSLRGVAHTAPYLHSGSATDLGEVIDYAASGKMGDGFSLEGTERDDLIAYLKSR